MAKMMSIAETREFCETVMPHVILAAAMLHEDDTVLLADLEREARDALQTLGCPARFMTVEVQHVVMLARDGHPDGMFA